MSRPMAMAGLAEIPARDAGTAARSVRRVAVIAPTAATLLNLRGALIHDIMAQRHRVLCLAPDFTAPQLDALGVLGIECDSYPLEGPGIKGLNDLALLSALSKSLKAWKPHVVLGYGAKPAIYGALAARRAKAQHIIAMLSGLAGVVAEASADAGAEPVGNMMAYYRWRALRSIHGLVLHNRDDHQTLTKLALLPRDLPVQVVRGAGVDLAQFAEQPLPSLGQGLVFVMIAHLRRAKGVEVFCRAAAKVRAHASGARFILAGAPVEGPQGIAPDDLNAWSGAVDYIGPQDDVRVVLASAHVVVQPSLGGEGLPKTLLEALATGRPVITSDTHGCRDTVDERVNGCLVPPGDADALARAMESFLRRPDLIPSMARASRRKAERRFDVRAVNEDMMSVLGLG